MAELAVQKYVRPARVVVMITSALDALAAAPAFGATYRPGATIEMRVTQRRKIGKYTRVKTRRGKAPLRIDRCLMPGSTRPVRCPPG